MVNNFIMYTYNVLAVHVLQSRGEPDIHVFHM